MYTKTQLKNTFLQHTNFRWNVKMCYAKNNVFHKRISDDSFKVFI